MYRIGALPFVSFEAQDGKKTTTERESKAAKKKISLKI